MSRARVAVLKVITHQMSVTAAAAKYGFSRQHLHRLLARYRTDRIRHDHVSPDGKISLRRAGRMHHLGIGIAHARKRVLILIDQTTVTVIELTTGELLSEHDIHPDRNYWRNKNRSPGRWPGLP